MNQEGLSKHERRELKEQMRIAKRAVFANKQTLVSALWWIGIVLVIGGLIAYVVWDIVRPLSGTKVAILERKHVPDGEKIEWNSNPPTSGAHYQRTEEWGTSDAPLSMGRLVHNLEHGGVIIFYNCQNCDDLIKQLKDITRRLAKKDKKIILVPEASIDSKIALAAWGWHDKMDAVDEDRIWKFFDDHINKGPERVLM